MHRPWESYRVHCTIRSIHPMSWYRRSSTASPCTRINWYHLVGWHVAKHKISTERYGQDETLIECERTVQLHFLFPTSKQFDHTKQTDQHEKGRLLFNPILYRQLEPNLPFNRMLFLPFRGTRISWIESGYHRNADVLHRSTVVDRSIVNDHCGNQIVVLVDNLQIGGSHEGQIHLDHLAISRDINHVRSIERSR